MGNVALNEKIPNNVDLASDRKLQKALESWQPSFLDWWMDMGPEGFQMDNIYLRTAVNVGAGGWAHFDYVKMPDYRWGIFLAPSEADRTIGFGDVSDVKAWDKVPGDHRKDLRRIIVTQADTEPASVEQQRLLGKCAPSLYDLRNLFQVNVEEGRHLWAMVYLLHSFFGRDGREEADDLLARRSGDADSPRILDTFNRPIDDWLAFYCFTMFTDRDGKYQLAALAESGFDPLAQTTKFMLTEEAHHLFVGEMGILRVVQRTTELMKEDPNEDVTNLGGIPLDLLQRYINEWYSSSLDLFGAENSSNAASYFAQGIKGRYKEQSNYEDHLALEGEYEIELPDATGALSLQGIPMRRAMNLVLRDSYRDDCSRALRKWNKLISDAGIQFEITLPHQRFNRIQGVYSGFRFDPEGKPVTQDVWDAKKDTWLATEADKAYIQTLMKPCYEPGKFANWIAPPNRGINRNPVEFKYVDFVGHER